MGPNDSTLWSGAYPIVINNSTHTTTVASSSDKRTKNHIKWTPYDESVGLLRCADVVQYTYKNDPDNITRNGLYAQDILKYMVDNDLGYRPYLQIQNQNSLEDNTSLTTYDITVPEEDVMYSLDYKEFIPDLWNGWRYHDDVIQQQKEEIDSLKQEIKELKQQLVS
jgi:hypothetical protein